MRFEVQVVYEGLCCYVVEAETPEQAEEKAKKEFQTGGHGGEVPGYGWEKVQRVQTIGQLRED